MTDSIAPAIATCNSAHNAETSARAYESILDAVGNNHAGTYGPFVLPMIDALEQVLAHSGPWPQHAALEAIVDLCGSFEPTPLEDGQLSGELFKRVASLEPLVSAIAAQPSVASDSARQLLELLHDAA
jgi:hypothetical protein